MTEINDGGAAFPCEGGDLSGLRPDPGMTLRDWFAGQIAGHLAASTGIGAVVKETGKTATELVAKASYRYADAMLKAREGVAP